MSCEHIQIPGGGTAIVCGLKRKKKERCAFCGSPANRLCDWKTEKPKEIPVSDLAMGDVIETHQKKYHLPVKVVARLNMRNIQSGVVADVTMYGLRFPDERCFLYYGMPWTRVKVLRPGTCDKPCCETCSRSVGEDRDYCRDHWRSWEFDTSMDQRMEVESL